MEPTPIARVPDSRLHVLEVVGNGIVGGMESVVQRLIERLPRERFAVTAMCPAESPLADRLRALAIEVVIVPMPDDPPWPSVQTAHALVQSHGIDVIHSHLENAHLLAGLVGSLSGIPVLATVHGRQISMLDLEVHRAAGTHLNVVCRHSHLHALGVGISASHLSWIPNGVDTEVFCPGPRSGSGLRRDLGIPDNVPLIGCVGRFSAEKGPEVFVRASLLLCSLLPEAHFVMVGDGPMRDAMQAMSRRFRIDDRLHLPGVRDDMPEVYRQLDLLVCSSHSEAMPLALTEAMATGLPVIGTRVGGVPDLIEPGLTGHLVAPGDFQGISNRVMHVYETKGELASMGEAARARAVERFNLDASVTAIGRLLTELGARRSTWRSPRSVAGATG
jgi:glycosyltransferase involved in cell wall biosynthesis